MDYQKCLNRNIIKSRLLFAMVLMTCCQPIRCLDLSYYAARLGITRTPTRKEFLMIGAGILFTAAAVYFLKNRWKGEAASGAGSRVRPPKTLGAAVTGSPPSATGQSQEVTIGDKTYSAQEWSALIKSIPLKNLQDLFQDPSVQWQQRITNITKRLNAIYGEQGWPVLDIPQGLHVKKIPADANKLLIADAIDKLDILYTEQRLPGFCDWFIPLLAFDYSNATTVEKDLIWCYILYSEDQAIEKWNRFKREPYLSQEFEKKAKDLFAFLMSTAAFNVLKSTVWDIDNYVSNIKSVVLLVKFLDILYAIQRAPGIKDFHTVVIETQNLKQRRIETSNDLVSYFLKEPKEALQVLHNENIRLAPRKDQGFYNQTDIMMRDGWSQKLENLLSTGSWIGSRY